MRDHYECYRILVLTLHWRVCLTANVTPSLIHFYFPGHLVTQDPVKILRDQRHVSEQVRRVNELEDLQEDL